MFLGPLSFKIDELDAWISVFFVLKGIPIKKQAVIEDFLDFFVVIREEPRKHVHATSAGFHENEPLDFTKFEPP